MSAGEEGHAVDGDGHGAVLAVEVVDVVGGAEAGGDPGPLGRPQQQQQQQQCSKFSKPGFSNM